MIESILAKKQIHLVGIKGVAMTALALCLQDAGISVTGSDVAEDFVTKDILIEREFHVFHGFSPDNIPPNTDLVVYTGAHQGKNNLEVQSAVKKGISVLSHAEALGQLMQDKNVISVCGTGGKSTTSAMIAWVLDKSGLAPSFAIGVGTVTNFGLSGRYEKESTWFVAEADEYAVDPTCDHRPRFIYQHPKIIVCTNLKFDHPDIYADFEAMKTVFLDFFNSLPQGGFLVINIEDQDLLELSKRVRPDIQVFHLDPMLVSLAVEMPMLVPGEHNRRNAMLALAVADLLMIDSTTARAAMSEFTGTMRRFELKGEVNGAEWYDDYAHTPSEIQVTLETLRNWRPGKRVVAVFQPHTYSRTLSLFTEFSHCFTQADEVVLLDIFASAREKKTQTVSSDMLADAIKKVQPNLSVKNMKTIAQAHAYLQDSLTPNDVVITMGAGDVYKIYESK